MALKKPYYRIVRPIVKSSSGYVRDRRYAKNRLQLARAYLDLERELNNILNFIEPAEANLKVFSFELYSLLLRACTEVELNCKDILNANGYVKDGNFDMEDYKKIEQSSKLSKYRAVLPSWRTTDVDARGNIVYGKKILYPFVTFSYKRKNQSVAWYKAYNEVKHDRDKNFEKASLENCLNAVAAVLILLYSQFGVECLNTKTTNVYYGSEGYDDAEFGGDTMFTIIPPEISNWREDELYDFKWNDLKNKRSPFNTFDFE